MPFPPSPALPVNSRDHVWARVVPSAVRGSAIVEPLELICVRVRHHRHSDNKKKGRPHRGLVRGTFSLICPFLL